VLDVYNIVTLFIKLYRLIWVFWPMCWMFNWSCSAQLIPLQRVFTVYILKIMP